MARVEFVGVAVVALQGINFWWQLSNPKYDAFCISNWVIIIITYRGHYPCVSADITSGHNYLHFGHLGQNYCQCEAPTVISALTIFEV